MYHSFFWLRLLAGLFTERTGKRILKISRLAVRLGQVLLFFVVGYYLIYRNLVLNWQALAEQQWSFRLFPFMASLVAVAIIFALNSQIWRMIVFALSGKHLKAGRAAYIWFISNLGRYLPGKVWQLAGMAVLARREGVSAVGATASAIIGQVVHLLAGAAVGLYFLPTELTGAFAPLAHWAWLGLPPVIIFLYPPLLRKLLSLASRWSGKPPVEVNLKLRDLVVWFSLNVLVWLAYGCCFYYFVKAIYPQGDLSLAAAIGVYAVGYIIGFLVIFAPGGLGVRETMFAGLLTAVLGEVGATVTALGSRIWLTLAELVPVVLVLIAGGLPAFEQNDLETGRQDE